MSTVADEINRIEDKIKESYEAIHDVELAVAGVYGTVAELGGKIPADKTIGNLATAIRTIKGTGGGSSDGEDAEYAWWSPRMLSNTTAREPSLLRPDLQEKTVTPTDSTQVVTPDPLYDGLSKVTVKPGTDPALVKYTWWSPRMLSNSTSRGSGLVRAKLQEKTVIPTTSNQNVIADSNYDALSRVTVNGVSLQEKTVTPTTSQQIVTPDSNHLGLSKVTIAAAPSTTPKLEEKTVALTSTTQILTPSSGYDGFSKVTVPSAALQSKSVTPSTSSQTIKPDSSYYGLSQVSVSAIPTNYIDTSSANATASDILSGKTAYVNGSKVTGTCSPGKKYGRVTYRLKFGGASGYSCRYFEVGSDGVRSYTTKSCGGVNYVEIVTEQFSLVSIDRSSSGSSFVNVVLLSSYTSSQTAFPSVIPSGVTVCFKCYGMHNSTQDFSITSTTVMDTSKGIYLPALLYSFCPGDYSRDYTITFPAS